MIISLNCQAPFFFGHGQNSPVSKFLVGVHLMVGGEYFSRWKITFGKEKSHNKENLQFKENFKKNSNFFRSLSEAFSKFFRSLSKVFWNSFRTLSDVLPTSFRTLPEPQTTSPKKIRLYKKVENISIYSHKIQFQLSVWRNHPQAFPLKTLQLIEIIAKHQRKRAKQ